MKVTRIYEFEQVKPMFEHESWSDTAKVTVAFIIGLVTVAIHLAHICF